MSSFTKIILKNVLSRLKKLPLTLTFAPQTMIKYENVSWASTCRDTSKQSPKTYSEGRKTPRYSRNRATNYDLQKNLRLGISVSRYTEIILNNVLWRSRNAQVYWKPSNRLSFRTKSSAGDQRVETHRTQKGTPRNSQNRATNYDFWQNLLRHQRVEVHWNSPEKRTQMVEKHTGIFKSELQSMICDKIFSWASTYQVSPK